MAPLEEPTTLPIRSSKQSQTHPFAPLSRDEIRSASGLVQSQWPENTDLQFKAITLEEPAKSEAIPYIEAENAGKTSPSIDRRAFVSYYIRKTVSQGLALLTDSPDFQ